MMETVATGWATPQIKIIEWGHLETNIETDIANPENPERIYRASSSQKRGKWTRPPHSPCLSWSPGLEKERVQPYDKTNEYHLLQVGFSCSPFTQWYKSTKKTHNLYHGVNSCIPPTSNTWSTFFQIHKTWGKSINPSKAINCGNILHVWSLENLGLVVIYCNIILYHIIVIQENYHNLGWLLHPDLKVHAISIMTCKLQCGALGKLGAPQDALRLPHWGVVVHCPMLLDLNISPGN